MVVARLDTGRGGIRYIVLGVLAHARREAKKAGAITSISPTEAV
jgi:hypothetical protein